MKIVKIVIICCAVMCAGCVGQMTEENPLGIDPNDVRPWVDFGISVGLATQAGGVATGNPAMIGYGAALILIGGYITTLIGKGKKNGES